MNIAKNIHLWEKEEIENFIRLKGGSEAEGKNNQDGRKSSRDKLVMVDTQIGNQGESTSRYRRPQQTLVEGPSLSSEIRGRGGLIGDIGTREREAENEHAHVVQLEDSEVQHYIIPGSIVENIIARVSGPSG